MYTINLYFMYIKYNQKQNVSHLQFDQGSESKIYDLMVRFYNDQFQHEVQEYPYVTEPTLNVLYSPN